MGDVTPEFLAAVSAHTGVPEWLLTAGGVNTTEGIWSRASDAVEWAARTAPPAAPKPPTAAVSASIPGKPITPQGCAPDGDYLAAWRSGKLSPAGIPAPPPRQSRGMPW
jgi:hypothetical protein